jgi:hypothetical protein
MTKAPIKVSIEIHDVKDKDACTRALGQMYEIIAEHYGEGAWFRIAQDAARGLPQPPEWLAEKKMVNACRGIDPEKLRLVLEYYSMPRPNKQRLAIELAKKNETLPPIKRYGPKGTTDPMTMLTQQCPKCEPRHAQWEFRGGAGRATVRRQSPGALRKPPRKHQRDICWHNMSRTF